MPAFQDFLGCTRGSVLNRLITHQGRRVAYAQWRLHSLYAAFYAGAESAQWHSPGLRVCVKLTVDQLYFRFAMDKGFLEHRPAAALSHSEVPQMLLL